MSAQSQILNTTTTAFVASVETTTGPNSIAASERGRRMIKRVGPDKTIATKQFF
jgi:hypothetical protein